jgi:hypothetical protein
MNREEITKIALEENEKRLNISRVPKPTKDLFCEIAEMNYAGDYGLLLKTLLDSYMELNYLKQTFYENINMKLDLILNRDVKNEEKSSKVETFGTRRAMKGGTN